MGIGDSTRHYSPHEKYLNLPQFPIFLGEKMKDKEAKFIKRFSKEHYPKELMGEHHLSVILAVFIRKYEEEFKDARKGMSNL
jgi:hypothetical protein